MNLIAGTFETDMQLIGTVGLLALIFLTGLVWCGAVQLARIARSLQRIADVMAKKDEA